MKQINPLTGSNPVLTTLIKLVYEQPLRWDALIRNGSQVAELVDAICFGRKYGIIPTLNQIKDFTGSNPVLTTKK
jgi:hypothetical protein